MCVPLRPWYVCVTRSVVLAASRRPTVCIHARTGAADPITFAPETRNGKRFAVGAHCSAPLLRASAEASNALARAHPDLFSGVVGTPSLPAVIFVASDDRKPIVERRMSDAVQEVTQAGNFRGTRTTTAVLQLPPWDGQHIDHMQVGPDQTEVLVRTLTESVLLSCCHAIRGATSEYPRIAAQWGGLIDFTTPHSDIPLAEMYILKQPLPSNTTCTMAHLVGRHVAHTF